MMKKIHNSMLKNNPEEAHQLCIELAAIARMTAHKISIDSE
jgi:hypothetical protein